MTRKEKIILEFISKESKSNIDFDWKIKSYLFNGDLSFLGKRKAILDKKLKLNKKIKSSIKNVTS